VNIRSGVRAPRDSLEPAARAPGAIDQRIGVRSRARRPSEAEKLSRRGSPTGRETCSAESARVEDSLQSHGGTRKRSRHRAGSCAAPRLPSGPRPDGKRDRCARGTLARRSRARSRTKLARSPRRGGASGRCGGPSRTWRAHGALRTRGRRAADLVMRCVAERSGLSRRGGGAGSARRAGAGAVPRRRRQGMSGPLAQSPPRCATVAKPVILPGIP
jgi:hypothetical protein